ncbi:MAG TPA: hypothetical protein GYA11_03200 [Firmicutes bacterium]|nr:hypothetical protein [Bacillota bacterium]
MADRTIRREDIGDNMADGVKAGSEKFGQGSEKHAIHGKGHRASSADKAVLRSPQLMPTAMGGDRI